MFICFDRIYERDRQTDTHTAWQLRPCLVTSRGKNYRSTFAFCLDSKFDFFAVDLCVSLVIFKLHHLPRKRVWLHELPVNDAHSATGLWPETEHIKLNPYIECNWDLPNLVSVSCVRFRYCYNRLKYLRTVSFSYCRSVNNKSLIQHLLPRGLNWKLSIIRNIIFVLTEH